MNNICSETQLSRENLKPDCQAVPQYTIPCNSSLIAINSSTHYSM